MIDQAILLTGGKATRLGSITKVTNKHLLPIYDKPMIFYGLESLASLGVKRLTIILGGNSVGDVVNLVQDGAEFGLKVTYVYQSEPRGISHAIRLAKHTIYDGKFLVLLGDNIFSDIDSIGAHLKQWEKTEDRAFIVLTEVPNPQEYGQPSFIGKTSIISGFVEKSPIPIGHNYIITGLYGLDYSAFDKIDSQLPSKRRELEIVDTLKEYLPRISVCTYEDFWTDCGTPKGMIDADNKFYKDATVAQSGRAVG